MKYLYVIRELDTLDKDLVKLIDETGEEDVWTIYMPDKTTPAHEIEQVHELLNKVGVLTEHRLEISISAIIQKTWRIMKNYTEHEQVPVEGSEGRVLAQKELAQLNGERLEKLKQSIRQMVADDQARRLGLELAS